MNRECQDPYGLPQGSGDGDVRQYVVPRRALTPRGRVVLSRRQRRAATRIELPVEDRTPVIRAYMLRGGRPASTQLAREARDYFGVSADPTIDEIRSVADRYPVFRVVRGWSGSQGR
jgi:hypothetical protein